MRHNSLRLSLPLKTIWVILLWTASAVANDISLSASIDRTEIKYEEKFQMDLKIVWRGDMSRYMFEPFPLPETQNLKVVGTSSAVSSGRDSAGEYTSRSYRYTFQPTGSGAGSIEPVILKYITRPDSLPGELATQRFQVLIAPPLPQPEKSEKVSLTWYIVGGIAIVSFGLTGLIVARRRRVPMEPVKSAEDIFLEGLIVIKRESAGERKMFFTRIYKLLGQYLETRHGVACAGKTVEEIIGHFETKQLPLDSKDKIKEWLILAEKEKYAPTGHQPGETLRLATEMENFFKEIQKSA